MTPYERFMQHMRGGQIDRPLNFDIIMQFAAHFIGQPLSSYYLDYRVLCAANLAVLEAFSLDIVQAISDPYREAADWGAVIEFPHDALPISTVPLIADPADLDRLITPKPETGRRMSDRLEAIAYLRSQVGGQVPIMGWVEGSLAEAADLRGVSALMLDFYDRPDWVEALLERCVEVEIAFARAQVQAGADIIGLGDAIASQISPKLYERFALPYEQRIFSAVHELGALTRLHICGNTTRILAHMARSGADIIDIDSMVDMEAAASAFGTIPVCGNVPPVEVFLYGTPDQVRAAVLESMERGGSRAISAAGCEIPDGTPHANLHAQTQALAEIGARRGVS